MSPYMSAQASLLFASLANVRARTGLAIYRDAVRYMNIGYDSPTRVIQFESCTLASRRTEAIPLPTDGLLNVDEIRFRVDADGTLYQFSYSFDDGPWWALGKANAMDMSGLDFSGVIIGVYSIGEGEPVEINEFTVTHGKHPNVLETR